MQPSENYFSILYVEPSKISGERISVAITGIHNGLPFFIHSPQKLNFALTLVNTQYRDALRSRFKRTDEQYARMMPGLPFTDWKFSNEELVYLRANTRGLVRLGHRIPLSNLPKHGLAGLADKVLGTGIQRRLLRLERKRLQAKLCQEAVEFGWDNIKFGNCILLHRDTEGLLLCSMEGAMSNKAKQETQKYALESGVSVLYLHTGSGMRATASMDITEVSQKQLELLVRTEKGGILEADLAMSGEASTS